MLNVKCVQCCLMVIKELNIPISFCSGNQMSAWADTMKFKHILLQHREVMSKGPEDVQHVTVHHSHLFSDALLSFSRSH